jgi:hypothetical protein
MSVRAAIYAGKCKLCWLSFPVGAKIDSAKLFGFPDGYLHAKCAWDIGRQQEQARRIDRVSV